MRIPYYHRYAMVDSRLFTFVCQSMIRKARFRQAKNGILMEKRFTDAHARNCGNAESHAHSVCSAIHGRVKL